MHTAEINEQAQMLQDMLDGMRNQREAAQNECIQLAAHVRAGQRRETEKDTMIAALEAKLKELEPKVPAPNGHDPAGTAGA